MARSKAISYGRLIVKNLHTLNISTRSQNTKILKDTARCRMILSTTTAFHARRTFCDLSGKQELPTSPPPSSPWSSICKLTAGGVAVTAAIYFIEFKEDVDMVIETAEEIIDVVEVVAEAVDMVAEKIADDLADGSKLKTTVEAIEQVAENVAGKAQKAVDFIDEVQEAEKKLSPIIEPVKQLTQVAPSDAS
ncbi:hypothetical protein HanRHA438_Chr02g0068161 [Helianthus annuus]|uniref:Uncharacterized protein n=1 Tax=Helianthus annuus TaxID=4232 RepID=A0A9K3P089_HELAN|nr:hypothetical protein HanXRQr2_Chr02g0067041 [Helianthus annuus]KAJ0940039.1 hypothetical protein HanRHA438_Chr02g0068161 [Helianthus annuus]KAJ0951905.1 hypothetical protein HanPSC8_Chr02g0065881 [Helianthus annuus]